MTQQEPMPPQNEPKPKKKGGCLKWLGIGVGVVIAFGVVANLAGGGDKEGAEPAPTSLVVAPTTQAGMQAGLAEARASSSSAPISSAEPANAPASSEQVAERPASGGSREERNAARKAEQYLGYTAFSQKGLAQQLEYEGFSAEVAQQAAASMRVDWNEQAVKKGEQYQKLSPQSRQGLIDQLVFEGFTAEQAEFAASKIF